MRSLILTIVLSLAGCQAAPVPCDGHLSPINRTVAAVNGASSRARSGAPDSGGSP
jgi:hypothetical protein